MWVREVSLPLCQVMSAWITTVHTMRSTTFPQCTVQWVQKNHHFLLLTYGCVWLDWSSVSGRLLREMKGLSCVNYKIAGLGLTNCETQTKLRSTLTNVFMVDTKTQTKNRNLSGFEAAQKSFLSSTLSYTFLSSWDLTKGFRSLSRPSTMVTRVRLDFVTIQNRILKLNF